MCLQLIEACVCYKYQSSQISVESMVWKCDFLSQDFTVVYVHNLLNRLSMTNHYHYCTAAYFVKLK